MEGTTVKEKSALRARASNFNIMNMFKTNKKPVSVGLVVISVFALVSTVLSVNTNQESANDLEENANSSSEPKDPFQC